MAEVKQPGATCAPKSTAQQGIRSIRETADLLGLTRQQVVEAEKRIKRKFEQAGMRDWL